MKMTLSEIVSEVNPSLENPAEFSLKIKTYVSGDCHLIMRKIKHRIQRTKEMVQGVVTSYSQKSDAEKRQDALFAAVRRAKTTVKDTVFQIKADRLLTLTTRDNIQDREVFMSAFNRFIRNVREKDLKYEYHEDGTKTPYFVSRKESRSFPFCAVPELQKRGAYHIHCAVVGFQDVAFLRACWVSALGGNPTDTGVNVLGAIDVTSRRKRFGSTAVDSWTTHKLADYLVKYISKSFEDNDTLGIHRYTRSRSVPPVNVQKQNLLACYSFGLDGVDAMRETLRIADFIGVEDYFVWGRGFDVFVVKGVIK